MLDIASSLPRIAGWLAVPLALSGCAGGGRPAVPRHVSKPGYVCNVGQAFENGAWASARLDAEGRQVSAQWDWKMAVAGEPFLRVWSVGTIEGAKPPNARDGYASVQWAVPAPYKQRPALLRLELRVDPDSRYWFGSGFVSDYARTGDYLLMANWPDVAAFARGAPQLFVVLRDRQAKIVKRAAVDPALFARGEAQIAAILEELARKVADFRQGCQYDDDIDPEIVVT